MKHFKRFGLSKDQPVIPDLADRAAVFARDTILNCKSVRSCKLYVCIIDHQLYAVKWIQFLAAFRRLCDIRVAGRVQASSVNIESCMSAHHPSCRQDDGAEYDRDECRCYPYLFISHVFCLLSRSCRTAGSPYAITPSPVRCCQLSAGCRYQVL